MLPPSPPPWTPTQIICIIASLLSPGENFHTANSKPQACPKPHPRPNAKPCDSCPQRLDAGQRHDPPPRTAVPEPPHSGLGISVWGFDTCWIGKRLTCAPAPAVQLMTSLDHAMWFHAPFKADEWMLCVACGVIAARHCSRLLAALPDASSAVFVACHTPNFLCIWPPLIRDCVLQLCHGLSGAQQPARNQYGPGIHAGDDVVGVGKWLRG